MKQIMTTITLTLGSLFREYEKSREKEEEEAEEKKRNTDHKQTTPRVYTLPTLLLCTMKYVNHHIAKAKYIRLCTVL